jgi:hypothetical protein
VLPPTIPPGDERPDSRSGQNEGATADAAVHVRPARRKPDHRGRRVRNWADTMDHATTDIAIGACAPLPDPVPVRRWPDSGRDACRMTTPRISPCAAAGRSPVVLMNASSVKATTLTNLVDDTNNPKDAGAQVRAHTDRGCYQEFGTQAAT